MISFVVNRGGKHFDDMAKMWNWCEKQYGKPDYSTTWAGEFAYIGTEDFVRFIFYNEAMATWFALQFTEYILEDDEYQLTQDVIL
jgi:hypothetical protein